MLKLAINRPDDMHLHLRDGDILKHVINYSARDYGRAIIMPNLVPPITTVEMAMAYRNRILDAIDPNLAFDPLMTLYLTEHTTIRTLQMAADTPFMFGVKLYPAGATTNSDSGVMDIWRVIPALERMAALDIPLLVHGEVVDPAIDIFDREAVFIDKVLDPVRREIPDLRIVLEHVTTKDGIDYVYASNKNLYATLTIHHLILNRNALLAGGIRPHYYCLPVLKREIHRRALRRAATSGDQRFFLGTDSAPHLSHMKENACGCAGVFSAANSLGCLATVFEEEKALEHLNSFTSVNGASFYGLKVNPEKTHLVRKSEPAHFPKKVAIGQHDITVFDPGFPVFWHIDRNRDVFEIENNSL